MSINDPITQLSDLTKEEIRLACKQRTPAEQDRLEEIWRQQSLVARNAGLDELPAQKHYRPNFHE